MVEIFIVYEKKIVFNSNKFKDFKFVYVRFVFIY
jgi:hypothetical protein